MKFINIFASLFCLGITTLTCKAKTVPMEVAVGGVAILQPNGEYEVPEGGTATFTAKLPKMPQRDVEIWLFNWKEWAWFLDGAKNITKDGSYNLTKNPDRGPITINLSCLLTYNYIRKITSQLDYDYGQSDLFILNFK